MSAPYVTVVVKESADGYEFPVASYVVDADETIKADALAFAQRVIATGEYRSDGELIFDRMEREG